MRQEDTAPAPTSDLRLHLLRVLVWAGATLIVLAFYPHTSPWAWRAAAFAGFYNGLIWLLARRSGPRNSLGHSVDLTVDLASAALLTTLTGGQSSPFAPLAFLIIGEGLALFGGAGALWMAAATALLSLAHLRTGVDLPSSLLRWCLQATLLLACGTVLRLGTQTLQRGGTVLKKRTLADVERQVEELQEQNRQIRAAYRDMAAAVREQKEKQEEALAGRQILAVSAEVAEAHTLYERILQEIMGLFGAGGAALWRREGDRMVVRALVGRVAPILREEPVVITEAMQPSDIRRACERALERAAPLASPPAAHGTGSAPPPEEGRPLLCALLREEESIQGAVGFCEPQAGRFALNLSERLNALAPITSLAVRNIEQHAHLRRAILEMTLLQEVGDLARTAASPDAIYPALVEMVGRVVAYENCTLFVLDPKSQRLVARSTVGQIVNLIDHIPFARGSGVSGWVAQQKKPLYIPDLTREKGLLDVELLPPRTRSFLAVPMLAQERVIGVLNISHSAPHAFSPEDVRLLAQFAGQAAIAIERGEAI